MQLSVEAGHQLFLAVVIIAVPYVVWMPLTWILLSIFTPKKLLDQYFKQPHFSLAETVLMARFPGFLMRTAIFGWMLFFPSLATKHRKIYDIQKFMPRWYELSLKLFIIVACSAMVLCISLIVIGLVF